MSLSDIAGNQSQPWQKFAMNTLTVDHLICADIQPRPGGTTISLLAGETRTNMDVAGVSKILFFGGGVLNATVRSLSGGVDGQVIQFFSGNEVATGTMVLKHNFTTGAPGEQSLFNTTLADVNLPANTPGNIVATRFACYNATLGKWLVS